MRSASTCSLVFLLFLLAGCTQPEKPGLEEPGEEQVGPPEDVRIDPLALAEDRVVVPEDYPRRMTGQADQESSEALPPQPIDGAPADALDISRQLTGQAYRVQLHSTLLYREAQNARRVAEEIFDRPIHVDYEVPYFKVRVGTFESRDDAEEYSLRARGAGYQDAWVVIVNLDVKEPEPLYDSLPSDSDSPLNDYDTNNDG